MNRGISYSISSRDYLLRARTRLSENSQEALFYAAFELRCGIEARYQEYLEAWKHISDKKKKGWKVANLAKDIEQEFKTGDKIAQIGIYDKTTNELFFSFYYTPVTSDLKKAVEKKLNGCLHAMRTPKSHDDIFWDKFRKDLIHIADRLELANRGILLGPPLTTKDEKKFDLNFEVPDGIDPHCLNRKIKEKEFVKVSVRYLNELPDPVEKEAILWDFHEI